jgi:O-antigen/teichoic acid export membrane protein
MAVLLLQAGLGPAAVGQYSAAARLVEPSQIIPASLMAAVFPAFTVALRGQAGGARALGFRASTLLLIFGVAALFGYWFFGPVLVSALYGPNYAGSSIILKTLALSIPLAYVNYSLTHYLVAYGRQMLIGLFTAAMLLTHLLLSWALIPRVGAVGPAISTVIAEALLTVLCVIALALRRRNKRPAITSLVASDSPASSASP